MLRWRAGNCAGTTPPVPGGAAGTGAAGAAAPPAGAALSAFCFIGAGATALRNQNGVVIYLTTTTRGLNFKITMGNILTLTPALTISQTELGQAFDILERCIAEVESV